MNGLKAETGKILIASANKQELRQIAPESEVGPRVVDALVKVNRHDGTPHAVYVHVEIQGRREKDIR